MAFAQAQSQHGSLSEMNITPLIDVMLVLLVIFMIAAPVVSRPIPLFTPSEIGEMDREPLPPIALQVNAAGDIAVNGNPIAASALRSVLSAEATRDAQQRPALEIDASGAADYQVVARVLGAAEDAGLQSIQFVRHQ